MPIRTDPRGEGEAPTGRRGLLTPEVRDGIADALRVGAHPSVAAQAQGVAADTFTRWLKRGRDELARVRSADEDDDLADLDPLHAPYVELLLACERATAEAETAATRAWHDAIPTDWRAARDFLRYRHSDRWAASSSVTVSTEESARRVQEVVEGILADIPGLEQPRAAS